MKAIKTIVCVILAVSLLVLMVSASNHSASFWRLIKEEKSYLYFHEDFSELTWTKSYRYDGSAEYISQSNVRVIPQGGVYSTAEECLTVYTGEALNKIIQIKIPYDNLNAKENFALDKLTYFVVTYDLWTDTVSPEKLSMRPYVFDEYNQKTYTGSDFSSLSHNANYKPSNNAYSVYTFADQTLSMSQSNSERDKVCCVIAVNPDDVSKSTVSYYVNGRSNELTYSNWITDASDYISQFELTFKSSYAGSISIDNFSVYAFDRSFKGEINDVLKEVNYK